jgi:hypothetical protein
VGRVGDFSHALNEQELKKALTDWAVYTDAGFLFGNFGLSYAFSGYWGYYLSLGANLPGASAGVQYTFAPTTKIEGLGWHQMEQGIRGSDLRYGPASHISCGCQ